MLFNVPDEGERNTYIRISASVALEDVGTRKRNTKAEREKEGEEGEIGSLASSRRRDAGSAAVATGVHKYVRPKEKCGKKNVIEKREEREEKKVDEEIFD